MQADLKPLEFEAIRRLLERLSCTPYGGDAARNLEPAPTLDIALSMQGSVSAARQLLDSGKVALLGNLPDIRAALRQANSPGASLSSQALHNIQTVMQSARKLKTDIQLAPAIYAGDAEHLEPPAALEARLKKTLVGAGTLRDDASEELAQLFTERNQLRDEMDAVLKKRVAQEDIKAAFKDGFRAHWHMERAAIVIHRDLAHHIKGVRRGSLMGGRDVIMEPLEAVPLNNQIEAVVGKINQEQQRLLRSITDTVRDHVPAMEAMISAIMWIDLALAAGQLSLHMNAHAPTLVAEPLVDLKQAYHPLLLIQFAEGRGPQPVPLTLQLDESQSLLVVTGPNTGGKTVALKTLGLLSAMAHAGLHIPADQDCVMGHFSKVIVDVGDHQSLFHHLSTFAGHVEVLKRMLQEADANTLVLLDELGTGTDPEEGAALAMAVLDELSARQVRGIVNTHLSPLKDYATNKTGVENASMQFDHETLSPTYCLEIGKPGVSLGLTIAEKNGLDAQLVDKARVHLQKLQG